VIIPTFSERESNARRVAATGAGAFVRVENGTVEKRVNVENLRKTVRRVLSNPSFAENAKRIAQKLRTCGPSQAAQLIERFCRGELQPPPNPQMQPTNAGEPEFPLQSRSVAGLVIGYGAIATARIADGLGRLSECFDPRKTTLNLRLASTSPTNARSRRS
jgi:hypothetical protein